MSWLRPTFHNLQQLDYYLASLREPIRWRCSLGAYAESERHILATFHTLPLTEQTLPPCLTRPSL